jgi:hypothetical protein
MVANMSCMGRREIPTKFWSGTPEGKVQSFENLNVKGIIIVKCTLQE